MRGDPECQAVGLQTPPSPAEIINYLLEKGAKTELACGKGPTALLMAIETGNAKVLPLAPPPAAPKPKTHAVKIPRKA